MKKLIARVSSGNGSHLGLVSTWVYKVNNRCNYTYHVRNHSYIWYWQLLQYETNCLLNHLIRRTSKKTSKLRVTGLWAGNSPVTGEFPAQRASNAENVSIWWRHHEEHLRNTSTGICSSLGALKYDTDNWCSRRAFPLESDKTTSIYNVSTRVLSKK